MPINDSANTRRTSFFPAILLAAALLALVSPARDAAAMPPALPDDPAGWQQCQNLADDAARLACYDRWAGRQMPPAATPSISPAAAAGSGTPSIDQNAARIAVDDGNDDDAGCHDRRYSVLSRFWELEKGSDCGTFGLRSYRPLGIAFSIANRQPETAASPSPGHTETPQDYRRGEMRINLSLRTKLAQNLFTRDTPGRKDSLWFGYTQQSTWQVFTNGLSRPFRTTDHEPELMYVYPVDMPLSDGWRWRYAGLGISHQSNGQALPLSRSWNRVYLMGGIELDDRWRLTARAWQRIPESEANDDNPDIVRYIGRAELAGWWTPSAKNSYGVTWRAFGRGSVRLEWLRALGHPENSNLRLHAQLFHGYGDTLLDYNRRRTIFSVGLSLVDF